MQCKKAFDWLRVAMAAAPLVLGLSLLTAAGTGSAQNLTKMKAGMVTGIDQVGLPIALERGFFEKHGLDVTLARPYATGVDALNALQAGESDIVQVGVPMIGAVLRGMDLVALGNYSGNATKLGSDATMALIAGGESGIRKGDLASLKGKKIAASFGTINHLYVLALLEKGGLTPNDVTLVNTPPPDMTVALLSKGIDAFTGWDPWPIIALKDVPGAVEVIRGGDVISYLGFNVANRGWVEKNGETIEKFLAGGLRSRQLDARQSETGGAGRHPMDSGSEGGRRRGGHAVQHPAGRPAPVGEQLPRALVGAGPAAAPGLPQVDLRRQQAHRAEAHAQRDEGQAATVRRPSADSGSHGHHARVHVPALKLRPERRP